MPRYVIQRTLGDITDGELQAAAEKSKQVRETGFPEIDWEHSHVVRMDGGLTSFCVYGAPDIEVIRAHAAAVGIPVDRVHEIHAEILPQELPRISR